MESAPLSNHYLRLLQRVEDIPIQALLPQLSIEALTAAVLLETRSKFVFFRGAF
jgi:hypothetical protein